LLGGPKFCPPPSCLNRFAAEFVPRCTVACAAFPHLLRPAFPHLFWSAPGLGAGFLLPPLAEDLRDEFNTKCDLIRPAGRRAIFYETKCDLIRSAGRRAILGLCTYVTGIMMMMIVIYLQGPAKTQGPKPQPPHANLSTSCFTCYMPQRGHSLAHSGIIDHLFHRFISTVESRT